MRLKEVEIVNIFFYLLLFSITPNAFVLVGSWQKLIMMHTLEGMILFKKAHWKVYKEKSGF